jgi:hypothetical protein
MSSSSSSSESTTSALSTLERWTATLAARDIAFDYVGTQRRLEFGEQWTAFIGAARSLTGQSCVPHDNSAQALERFLKVMKKIHANKEEFKFLLFWALRDSLGELCQPKVSRFQAKKRKAKNGSPVSVKDSTGDAVTITAGGPIMLKNCNVGFVPEVSRRQELKLPNNYGWSTRGPPDLACIVFGDALDVAACVELQVSHEAYKLNVGQIPALAHHAPQSLLYAMDVHHCLTRRGHLVESIPAIVLAAKSKKNAICEDRLCCMEASFNIPQHLGGTFEYRIEQCIRFPCRNDDAQADALYEQALAIFVHTLRFGLINAKAVQENKKRDMAAASLCCSLPRADLLLLASPIPGAQPSVRGLKISQGELYAFKGVNKSVEQWINIVCGKREKEEGYELIEEELVLIFDGSRAILDDCIVKVSCSTVHKQLVPARETWQALEYIEHEGTVARDAIAKVLLACAHVSRQCLVVVMKDLGAADKPDDWAGFSKLVRTALLPLAGLGVVHTDIRFDPKKRLFCNIVEDKHSGEWQIIDFESLVILRGAKAVRVLQKYAVSVPSFRQPASSFTFLHWQVLWVAYVLWASTTNQKFVEAKTFVETYSSSDQGDFLQFNDWMGSGLPAFPTLRDNVLNGDMIRLTLEFFDCAFSSGTSTGAHVDDQPRGRGQCF